MQFVEVNHLAVKLAQFIKLVQRLGWKVDLVSEEVPHTIPSEFESALWDFWAVYLGANYSVILSLCKTGLIMLAQRVVARIK